MVHIIIRNLMMVEFRRVEGDDLRRKCGLVEGAVTATAAVDVGIRLRLCHGNPRLRQRVSLIGNLMPFVVLTFVFL